MTYKLTLTNSENVITVIEGLNSIDEAMNVLSATLKEIKNLIEHNPYLIENVKLEYVDTRSQGSDLSNQDTSTLFDRYALLSNLYESGMMGSGAAYVEYIDLKRKLEKRYII